MSDTSVVFEDAERREIAGRARTLRERLEGPPNEEGAEPPIDPDEIVAEWRAQFPSEAAFRERLDRDGLTVDEIREHASATRWPSEEPLPDWLETLTDLVGFVQGDRSADEAAVHVPEETTFRALIADVVAFAAERLPEGTVPNGATESLEAHLAARLELTCVRALYVEFKSFLAFHDPELAERDPDDVADPSTEYYDQFVAAMRTDGFERLCLEYPVLARQIVTLVEQWVATVQELSERIRTDRAALERTFDVEGPVVDLDPLTHDAHAGGRVPVRASFERGSVIYKPRPVDGEKLLYTVLERLADHLSAPAFESPTLLVREAYGWMEPVEYADLPSAESAERYYERAGVFTGLAYLLHVTDCHYENVIASGDAPMLVDGETVLEPPIGPAEKPFDTRVATVVDRSVLLSGLLSYSVGDPREPSGGGRYAEEINGLGSDSGEATLADWSRPAIRAPNTDAMAVEMQPVSIDRSENTPSFDGTDEPPEEHVEAVVEGFEDVYETIRSLHEDGRFLTEIAPPELLDEVETRALYRSTGRYGAVLRAGTARDPLRDGARLSVTHERLAVPFFDGVVESDRLWPLYEHERRAMTALDIPRFGSRSDDRAITHRGDPTGVETVETGREAVERTLDRASAADRREQTWLLRQALGESVVADGPPPAATEPASRDLETAAKTLFDDAIAAAVETGDGRGWISIAPATGVTLYPAEASLYWGTGGIAVTAAALHALEGGERYRAVADEAIEPVLAAVDEQTGTPAHGGFEGLGSSVYCLSVVADLLGDERYRAAAVDAATGPAVADLTDATEVEVMSGLAGTTLGLLACQDRFDAPGVLDRAVACGDRLLEARTEVDDHLVWETGDDGRTRTGFAHGTTGVGYALARLADETDEDRFETAAREAFAFEAALYDDDERNWAQSVEEATYQDRWCHGRTGMSLARVGAGRALGEERLLERARTTLEATADAEPSHLDTLCCGNFGRVEALQAGARRADARKGAAESLARRALARRTDEGHLSLPGHSRAVTNPTLFDGVCGPAYGLLRLENPDALPSLLLFE